MRTWEKLFLAASVLVWLYVSAIIHLSLLERGGPVYDALVWSAVLSFFACMLFVFVNAIVWGIDYGERKKKGENAKELKKITRQVLKWHLTAELGDISDREVNELAEDFTNYLNQQK